MMHLPHMESVTLDLADVRLDGALAIPTNAAGLVLFAHGSGSGYRSARNNFVAARLHQVRLGTLLFDLLSAHEAVDSTARFDIGLLSARLAGAHDWLRRHARTATLPVGLFGASTGAAAALEVAALSGREIGAVVARGGRPDLATPAALGAVRAPTLLIVGGLDTAVIKMNRAAYARLRCEKRLDIVPDAGHLFVEPGTLSRAAGLAVAWFAQHLGERPN